MMLRLGFASAISVLWPELLCTQKALFVIHSNQTGESTWCVNHNHYFQWPQHWSQLVCVCLFASHKKCVCIYKGSKEKIYDANHWIKWTGRLKQAFGTVLSFWMKLKHTFKKSKFLWCTAIIYDAIVDSTYTFFLLSEFVLVCQFLNRSVGVLFHFHFNCPVAL